VKYLSKKTGSNPSEINNITLVDNNFVSIGWFRQGDMLHVSEGYIWGVSTNEAKYIYHPEYPNGSSISTQFYPSSDVISEPLFGGNEAGLIIQANLPLRGKIFINLAMDSV